jgi:RimJ/RimL family protein N-acetyltransferase
MRFSSACSRGTGVERRVRPDFPLSCVPYQRTLWALERKGEMIELETDRMLIRDVRAWDADAFHQYMRQEQYWRDAPIEPPTPESVEALVNRSVENQSQSPRTDFFLAAIDKRSEQLVGEAISARSQHSVAASRDRMGRQLNPHWAWFCDRDWPRNAAPRLRRPRPAPSVCSVPRRESGLAPDHGQTRNA